MDAPELTVRAKLVVGHAAARDGDGARGGHAGAYGHCGRAAPARHGRGAARTAPSSSRSTARRWAISPPAGFAVAILDWRGQGGSDRFPACSGSAAMSSPSRRLSRRPGTPSSNGSSDIGLPQALADAGPFDGRPYRPALPARQPARFAAAAMTAPMFGIRSAADCPSRSRARSAGRDPAPVPAGATRPDSATSTLARLRLRAQPADLLPSATRLAPIQAAREPRPSWRWAASPMAGSMPASRSIALHPAARAFWRRSTCRS